MCMCVYIYIYIYIMIYIYIYLSLYIYIYIYKYTHRYLPRRRLFLSPPGRVCAYSQFSKVQALQSTACFSSKSFQAFKVFKSTAYFLPDPWA